ncbi:hypothetical protein HYPSUDRAFT_151713, partial [Hypholoma sublateritium FD-334 SS-4]
MPIRLIQFDRNGKGITLIERSEVVKCISSEISNCNVADLKTWSLHKQWQSENYAILSHTWLQSGEVTYSNWRNHTTPLDTQSPGYDKLAKFCQVSAKRGFRLGWMDTVCINKESSAELDESIRSMFKWYKKASICIVYLAETTSLDDLNEDKWFTRGWTLQELLAPDFIKFFSKTWTELFNNPDLTDKSYDSPLLDRISGAAGLHRNELEIDSRRILRNLTGGIDDLPIWRKMQWAANRNVTRGEDAAYSLMGIFNISMPTGYGEGVEHAFLRLVKEILNS